MRSIVMIVTTVALYATAVLAAPAAPRNYHDWPEIIDLPDTSRIQIYDPREPVKLNRHKNITGSKLKDEIRGAVNEPNDTPISKQPIDSSPYKRTYESKEAGTGKINWYVQANGTVTVVGQLVIGAKSPEPLSVVSVYPVNGSTGIPGSTVPYVVLNKGANITIATIYIVGSSTDPVYTSVCVSGCSEGKTPIYEARWTIPVTLAAGTTYTIRVVRSSIDQTDGETTSTCGPIMTDVAGVCESTFTVAP